MKNLSLVFGVLFLGGLGQASPLVCQGYNDLGKLIPVKATIVLHPLRAITVAQGETTITIGNSQAEFDSTYFHGMTQTRCAAGPTLYTDIQDELSVDLDTWNPCISPLPAVLGKTDYHGSITIKDAGASLTFNVGCKYVPIGS